MTQTPARPRSLPFLQVDVFTARPLLGNPLAVVLDAAALDAEQMQRIAAWTKLSETTFVLPSERCDYGVRIFTPTTELPFAGHPTVGSAHAVLEAGLVKPREGRFSQECGAGEIALRVDDAGRIWTRVPPHRLRDTADGRAALARELTAALGGELAAHPEPLALDVGPVWLVARIESVARLAALAPDPAALDALSRAHGLTGVTLFAFADGGDAALRVRSFAPAAGVPEDPVCGSGNACVGAYLEATGLLARCGAEYEASQGRELGRDGRVGVGVSDEGIEIGGHAVTVIAGSIAIA